MKAEYKKIADWILMISAVIIISFLYYNQIQSVKLIANLEYNNTSIAQYLNSEIDLIGEKIWEVGFISKQEFLSENNRNTKVFFWYNKQGCSDCYSFHVKKLTEDVGKENIAILYNGEFEYLKRDFRGAHFIDATLGCEEYKQLLLLVNPDGRILYADFPGYEAQLKKGKDFYRVAARFIN